MAVRGALSPALLCHLRVTGVASVVPRGTNVRVHLATMLELSEIIALIVTNGIDVIGIREVLS